MYEPGVAGENLNDVVWSRIALSPADKVQGTSAQMRGIHWATLP